MKPLSDTDARIHLAGVDEGARRKCRVRRALASFVLSSRRPKQPKQPKRQKRQKLAKCSTAYKTCNCTELRKRVDGTSS